jgi:hypothetical protein
MLSTVDILCYDSSITAVLLGGESEGVRGGWAKGGRFLCRFMVFCCCNSYVNRSIELCMYVDDTKFDLTPNQKVY